MKINFNLNKKYIIYLVVSIIVLSLGITFAYYSQGIVGTGTSFSLKNIDLTLRYTNSSDGSISESDLVAPWSTSRTITVTNNTGVAYSYNLIIEDLINELSSGTLTYSITETNNAFTKTATQVPVQSTASDYVIGYNIQIANGVTHTYTVTFTYPDSSTVDQTNDMGASFSGTLNIDYPFNITVNLTNGLLSNNTTTITSKANETTTFNLTANSGYNTVGATVNCTNGTGVMSTSSSTDGGIGVLSVSNVTGDVTCNVVLNTAVTKVWSYVDSDSSGTVNVGDKITFVGTSGDETESFYVISNDGTNINMLAEWNLNVGGEYDGSSWTAYTTYTGIQSSDMKGYVSTGMPYKGTIAFSSTNYWSSTCTSYPCDLDLTSSNIATPLANYKTYLVNNGADSSNLSLRLIKYSELVSLGCDASSYTCSSAPSWVKNTSFWSRSAFSSITVWRVFSSGDFGLNGCSSVSSFGVRPVATIRNSDI